MKKNGRGKGAQDRTNEVGDEEDFRKRYNCR